MMRTPYLLKPLAAAFGLLICLQAAADTATPELPSGWTPKTITYTKKDMVAAANPLAVQTGVDILAQGGTAVDASIAIQMVLNLVEPQSSGIGGGAFMLTYDGKSGKVESYDGREFAPGKATERLFLDAQGKEMDFRTAVVGGRSVGIPGVLRLDELVYKEKGRLPWAKLFQPAIDLAEKGFALSPRLYAALLGADAPLKTDPVTGPYFYQADGTPKPVGTIIKNPELANTLRIIAANGADAFYTGAIAQDIVAKVKAHPSNPGLMELSDLAAYKSVKRTPVCGKYRDKWTICGMGMPSSGGTTVLQTLGILQNFDLPSLKPDTAPAVHLISEAFRLAYADRALYEADPDFICVPVAGLIDPTYLAGRAKLINLGKSMGVPTPGKPVGCEPVKQAMGESEEHGTTHMVIIDAEGNAVTMTTTVESAFGSYQMVRGFLLNNQLTDFNFTPSNADGSLAANRVQPFKRPRSSMAPTLVFDEKFRLYAALGSPGGSQIIQYVTKTLVGILDWKLNIQDAINLGNFGAATSATTILESGSSVRNLGPELTALGHKVSVIDINSGIHGITLLGPADPATSGFGGAVRALHGFAGGADPRREGIAAGH